MESFPKNLLNLLNNQIEVNPLNKDEKDKIEQCNIKTINEKFQNLSIKNLDNIKKNLPNYLSNALRINQYYGNLRIKYVTMNFTFLALFASILAIYISLLADFYLSLWYIELPIIIGLVLYFIYFIILISKNFDTISFKHSGLQHYSTIMDIKDYPEIKDTSPDDDKKLDNFVKIIQKEEKDLIKDDLKTLILLYLYQVNYLRVALIMRFCLIFGSIDLVLSISFSFLILMFSPYQFIAYSLLMFVAIVYILQKNYEKNLFLEWKKN